VTRLAERFAAAQGAPVELDGRLVHMLFELPPIEAPARLSFELRAGSGRAQGIRLKARGGVLEFADRALDDAVLWCETAPPTVTAEVRPREPTTVRVWNVWRDPAGTTQAWIGDAGMRVEEAGPGAWVLRCSDGFDAPTFDDLVVRLALNADSAGAPLSERVSRG
jgi:hypothetical protein